MKFQAGNRVIKTGGYPFPGIVDVAFATQAGVERYVVEFVDKDGLGRPTGLLHIFAPAQLEIDERFDSEGELYVEAEETADSEVPVVQRARPPLDALTPTELRVFDLVAKGNRNKQIAFDLGITERTVKAHRAAVMDKLGVASVAELVALAMQQGRIGP